MASQAVLLQAHEEVQVLTRGEGFQRIDPELNQWIAATGIQSGVLHLTCLHTSASLTINENADPRVLDDLAAWMRCVAPQIGLNSLGDKEGYHRYRHDDEGDDDMPAHIRTALTTQTMSLSVVEGQLLLGTWQAVYLWEHRAFPHRRRLSCHLIGDLHGGAKPADQSHATERSNTAAMLQRRNAAKLNDLVQARHVPEAWAQDGGIDTDVDLLIDRLHEISDQPQ